MDHALATIFLHFELLLENWCQLVNEKESFIVFFGIYLVDFQREKTEIRMLCKTIRFKILFFVT